MACYLGKYLKVKKIFIQQSKDSAKIAKNISNILKARLSDKEIDWLNSGKFVELESFTPQQLIQIVTSAIAKSNVSQTTDSYNNIYLDSSINYETIIELDTFG